jgi:uncharacterized membrane protein YdbT with pleckstrin-like domain
MSYPKHLLNDGESVALDLRPHWWFFSRHILTGVPLVVLIVLVTRISNNDIKNVLKYAVAAVAFVWAIWLLVKFLEWSRTYFVVSDQRVIFRTGILARRGVEIPLERINNINFNQGIWERIIGAGDLEVQSAGEQGTSQFANVRHPDGVQQEIYRQMESDATRDAGRGADAISKAVTEAMEKGGRGGAGIPEQIEQLARLRDQGTITAEEFDRKKAELLDKM